jgi:hypothetical protein
MTTEEDDVTEEAAELANEILAILDGHEYAACAQAVFSILSDLVLCAKDPQEVARHMGRSLVATAEPSLPTTGMMQ